MYLYDLLFLLNVNIQGYEPYIALFSVVVAVVIPVFIYFLQKKKRRLAYEELQNLYLLGINDDFKDKVEIKYAGQVVNNLFLTTAKLKNTGNVPIKRSEIISPIKIFYHEGFIECSIIGMDPEGIDIKMNVNIGERFVECDFDLLNPHDYFIFQFVSLKKLSMPTIVSRIEGLAKVNFVSGYDKGFFERKGIKLTFEYFQIVMAIVSVIIATYSLLLIPLQK